MVDGPARVKLSTHAERRAGEVGSTLEQVIDAVTLGHRERRRNPKEADWLASRGTLVVAYNWPHQGDPSLALVVTVWRR